MTRIAIGIATAFLGVMAACAVESGGPSYSTSETSAEIQKPGTITPKLCISFYQGAGNYYQCSTTEQWFHNAPTTCIHNCPGGSCTLDVICGSGGNCDCEGN
jgi:hypothetical protein